MLLLHVYSEDPALFQTYVRELRHKDTGPFISVVQKALEHGLISLYDSVFSFQCSTEAGFDLSLNSIELCT